MTIRTWDYLKEYKKEKQEIHAAIEKVLNSGRLMHMHIPYDEEGLIQLTLDLIRVEGWQTDIYIRPFIYKADMGIGVRLHDLKDELTIFSMPFKQYVKNETNAHVTVSSWRRIDDNNIM